MKRFYDTVSVTHDDAGWNILLDDRPVRTPGRAALAVPTETLADRIAQEWREQGETIDPRAMLKAISSVTGQLNQNHWWHAK